MSDMLHHISDAPVRREGPWGDSPELSAYAQAMADGDPFIRMTLDIDQAIELTDFVTAFTSLGAEYDRFARGDDGRDEHATLYVREVRQGSIEAILIPVLQTIAGGLDQLEPILALETFVRRYGGRLSTYLRANGRLPDASKSELKDFSEQVAAISHNPGSNLQVAAIEIVNGEQRVKAAFRFDTAQARSIRDNVGLHRYEIETASGDTHERVLMVFTRSDVRTTAIGKRSGEQVKIETISDRSVPIIYASELAERAIKYEITEAEDNVFKKGFIVDVNLEMRAGRLVAYRITNLHQVIDLPDDD